MRHRYEAYELIMTTEKIGDYTWTAPSRVFPFRPTPTMIARAALSLMVNYTDEHFPEYEWEMREVDLRNHLYNFSGDDIGEATKEAVRRQVIETHDGFGAGVLAGALLFGG